MDKNITKQQVKISTVIDTKPESPEGKGMLGFVITFPDGRMQNMVMDYATEDYCHVLKEINALHEKMMYRYLC